MAIKFQNTTKGMMVKGYYRTCLEEYNKLRKDTKGYKSGNKTHFYRYKSF